MVVVVVVVSGRVPVGGFGGLLKGGSRVRVCVCVCVCGCGGGGGGGGW